FQLPVEYEKDIVCTVELVKMKSYTYTEHKQKAFVEGEVPADMMEKCKEYRHRLVEKVVEYDDVLMEKYLAGGEVSVEELMSAIRKATLTGTFYPVVGGDGRGLVVTTILDAVINYLPRPMDKPAIKATHNKSKEPLEIRPSDSDKFVALAFKIATDPFVGKLAFFRVYTGKLEAGSYILNSRSGNKERVGRLVRLHADSREEV